VLMQSRPMPPHNESMRAIDARNAFVMSNLLQEVTRSGTAARAQATLKRTDIYGKTGTTNDSMDAWFAGYSPTMVAVVWIGYDTPRKLGDKETGGGLALPVWINFMETAIAGTPVQAATPPEGMVNMGGEWYYEEFTPANSVRALRRTQNDYIPPQSVGEDEKRSILELFGSTPSAEPTPPAAPTPP
jgi:penicillin-binding protein 1A